MCCLLCCFVRGRCVAGLGKGLGPLLLVVVLFAVGVCVGWLTELRCVVSHCSIFEPFERQLQLGCMKQL